MRLIGDPWIDSHSPIETEKLHALGYITFTWNVCEFHLFDLFCLTFGMPPNLAWMLAHDLGDVALSNRITAYLNHAISEPNLIQDLTAVIKNAL
jgi:hypothetical protein